LCLRIAEPDPQPGSQALIGNAYFALSKLMSSSDSTDCHGRATICVQQACDKDSSCVDRWVHLIQLLTSGP
ncbi:hypothetical protein SARC_11630, partial [Sphaeroforma arctica JP610]